MPAHYLLASDVTPLSPTAGRWRFTLDRLDRPDRLVVEDYESGCGQDRLELLAVVRGLEAIDEPARVTLLTVNPYIVEGLARGLDQWRADDWQWEEFGQRVPLPQADLWRRIDRALAFHTVDVRTVRQDAGHRGIGRGPNFLPPSDEASASPERTPGQSPSRAATTSAASRRAAGAPRADRSAGRLDPPTGGVPRAARRPSRWSRVLVALRDVFFRYE